MSSRPVICVSGGSGDLPAERQLRGLRLKRKVMGPRLLRAALGTVLLAGMAQSSSPATAFDPFNFFDVGRQIIEQSAPPRSGPRVRPHYGPPPPQYQQPVQRPVVPRYPASLVREVQERLNRLGYSAGAVDGLMGPSTRGAILAYQRDANLPPTGYLDDAVLTALRTAAPDQRQRVVENPVSVPPHPGGEKRETFVQQQPGGAVSFARLAGFDLPMGDYRSGLDEPALSGISAEACEAECGADSNCLSFTFNIANEICILKNEVPAPAPFAGAISGIKSAQMTRQPIEHTSSAPDVSPDAAVQPVAAWRIPEGLPQWRGRMVLRGGGGLSLPDGSRIEGANEAFARMAVLATLRKFPEIMESASAADRLFQMLDPKAQERLANEAGVGPGKVVGRKGAVVTTSGSNALNEFERARMLRVIRERVPPILLEEAPSMPIPALVFCVPSIEDYDFDAQAFPFDVSGCGAAVPSLGNMTEALANIQIHAPMPGGRLPSALPVPRDSAEAFKLGNFEAPPPDDIVRRHPAWRLRNPDVVAGVAFQVRDVVRSSNGGAFQVSIEPEQLHFFRIDRMNEPFATLDVVPPPSLATVTAELTGPLPVDDDTLALLLLKRGIVDLDDRAFREWTSARIWFERGDWPSGWVDFFARGVPQNLNPRVEDLSAELVSNFADWTRARAEALPNPAPILGNFSQFAQMATGKGSATVFAFRPLRSNNSSAKRLEKRLAIPADRLSVPGGRTIHEVPGIGPVQGIVVVLPAPADNYVVPLDRTPDARDELDVIVTARLGELRVDRGGEGDPLLVLAIEPLSARVVRSDGDAKGEEIGSAQFDTLAQTAETAETAGEPLPLGAEVTDLLRLRYLPETVDDQVMLRMMISRFAYEAVAPEPVFGGRFFQRVDKRPSLAELEQRVPEFRAWQERRATDLPNRFKVKLGLQQGIAPYETRGPDLWGTCRSVDQAERSGEALTDREEAQRRVCRYLEGAMNTPDTILYLKRSFSGHVTSGESRGPRAACGSGNPYCRSIDSARKEVGLPSGEGVRDLFNLDRLPLLDREALAALDKERDLELELVISPTGAELVEAWPETAYRTATLRAAAFAKKYGAAVPVPQEVKSPGPTFLHQARLLDARVLDAKTGEVLAEPELAVPASPPSELLTMDVETSAEWSILGIQLGDSFEEAEAAIREHMKVGRILVADRARQTDTLIGAPRPFGSARMYISEAEDEAIAIYDEPPAAADTVLGIWRLLYLPNGSLEPQALAASLTERYGEPAEIRRGTSLGEPVFLWSRFRPRDVCGHISSTWQHELWHGADGAPATPPNFRGNGKHYYPDFWSSSVGLIMDDGRRRSLSELCPLVLGVRYSSDPRTDQRDDELFTWLADKRRYGEAYFEGRRLEAEGGAGDTSRIQEPAVEIGVKF